MLNFFCQTLTFPSFQEESFKLSESKLQKLLFESKSPASVSCQIDMATPDNSGGYRMALENLQDVKLEHEVSNYGHLIYVVYNDEFVWYERGFLNLCYSNFTHVRSLVSHGCFADNEKGGESPTISLE